MALRLTTISEIPPFDYAFAGNIGGRMQDVGRRLGSETIGMIVQTIPPGNRASRRHRHVFQEEILVVVAGQGTLLHGDARIAVGPGSCVCYVPADPEIHSFENTGDADLVIWAFGNRFPHEVCLYPDEGVAFVEGLGAEIPLGTAVASAWTEEKRKR
ncbi:MAG: cupin domain-containing protein [Alphaproteobacteria bacterium]|nr:cupin domain-containing protein [Alphaproteobacteria bacterium]